MRTARPWNPDAGHLLRRGNPAGRLLCSRTDGSGKHGKQQGRGTPEAGSDRREEAEGTGENGESGSQEAAINFEKLYEAWQ